MTRIIEWLELHEKLSGWAQVIGALLALAVAIIAVHMQARYALRHEDRRTAERVRSLARTFEYWRDLCVRTYKIREAALKGQPVTGLGDILAEFNYTAAEINKFAFVDAPCTGVFNILAEYRKMCAPLSQFMSPASPAIIPANQLKEFEQLISRLEQMIQELRDDAKAIGG